VVTDVDLEPALEFHRSRGNLATLLLAANRERDEFTHVEADADGTVTGYVPFRQAGGIDGSGSYRDPHPRPEILDLIPDRQPFDVSTCPRSAGGRAVGPSLRGILAGFSHRSATCSSLELLRAQACQLVQPPPGLDPTAA
jgi:hypothetical protein